MIPLLDVGLKIIEKLIPDPAAKREAQMRLMELQQAGAMKELEVQMSAIIAEANSADPWTSRARPSFLYVVYIVVLAGIPMGVLFAVSPEVSANITTGFKGWLAAIPSEMWTLFGVGYLGYTGARTLDKRSK